MASWDRVVSRARKEQERRRESRESSGPKPSSRPSRVVVTRDSKGNVDTIRRAPSGGGGGSSGLRDAESSSGDVEAVSVVSSDRGSVQASPGVTALVERRAREAEELAAAERAADSRRSTAERIASSVNPVSSREVAGRAVENRLAYEELASRTTGRVEPVPERTFLQGLNVRAQRAAMGEGPTATAAGAASVATGVLVGAEAIVTRPRQSFSAIKESAGRFIRNPIRTTQEAGLRVGDSLRTSPSGGVGVAAGEAALIAAPAGTGLRTVRSAGSTVARGGRSLASAARTAANTELRSATVQVTRDGIAVTTARSPAKPALQVVRKEAGTPAPRGFVDVPVPFAGAVERGASRVRGIASATRERFVTGVRAVQDRVPRVVYFSEPSPSAINRNRLDVTINRRGIIIEREVAVNKQPFVQFVDKEPDAPTPSGFIDLPVPFSDLRGSGGRLRQRIAERLPAYSFVSESGPKSRLDITLNRGGVDVVRTVGPRRSLFTVENIPRLRRGTSTVEADGVTITQRRLEVVRERPGSSFVGQSPDSPSTPPRSGGSRNPDNNRRLRQTDDLDGAENVDEATGATTVLESPRQEVRTRPAPPQRSRATDFLGESALRGSIVGLGALSGAERRQAANERLSGAVQGQGSGLRDSVRLESGFARVSRQGGDTDSRLRAGTDSVQLAASAVALRSATDSLTVRRTTRLKTPTPPPLILDPDGGSLFGGRGSGRGRRRREDEFTPSLTGIAQGVTESSASKKFLAKQSTGLEVRGF